MPDSCSIQEEKPHLRRCSTLARKNLSRDFKSEAAVINVVQLGVRKKSDCSFPRWSVAISETAD